MIHWNLKTNTEPCQHNTEPKAWTRGRIDSGRRMFFVEIGGMSWRWDRYVPTAKRAELIAECFAEWAEHYGRIGTFGGPSRFANREARIVIREDHGKPWRGAYALWISMVDHDAECYVD